jgi:heme/copper-type cytochrome/quinol oxidase subunit 2
MTHDAMTKVRRFSGIGINSRFLAAMMLLAVACSWAQTPQPTPRVIEILADHDSRYKMEGQKQPVITARAGEQIILRITAKRAKNLNRDGSIHGFSLLRAKDRKPVQDWDFLLKPGIQEFTVAAPSEPGEYIVVCTVICSQDHEGMSMRFVVTP